jgi:hypothetical protein
MHLAAEDLTQIYIDVEEQAVQHIKDFHTNKIQFVLGSTSYGISSLKVLSTPYASLTVQISGGVGYYNFERIELAETYDYTVGNIPVNSGGGLNITRIDLLYIEKQILESSAFAIDFIDVNRNIYQQTKNTRSLDSYTIGIQTGVYNIGGAIKPDIPAGVIPLAWIHLRDATNKIYNYDTNSLNEGWIEDCRTVINSQII